VRTAIFVLAAAVALGACSRRVETAPGGQVTIRGDNGQSVTIGHQAPPNMPAYAPIYPGGQIVSTVAAPTGGVVIFKVAAAPDAVAAFYLKAASAAQLTSQLDSSSTAGGANASRSMIFGQEGSKRSLAVTIASQPDGQTQVNLMYGAA
jgi:hypothetical protein